MSKSDHILKGFSIVSCEIMHYNDLLRIILVAEENHLELTVGETPADIGKPHHTLIAVYKPEKPEEDAWAWQRLTGVSGMKASSCQFPNPGIICVSRDGTVGSMTSGHNGLEPRVKSSDAYREVVLGVKELFGHTYVACTGRRIFRRDGPGEWSLISPGLRPETENKTNRLSFRDLDGFAEDDIYAVGGRGDAWHYDGISWEQIELPITPKTGVICCAPGGQVYISGGPYLLVGRGKSWHLIYDERLKVRSFENITYFKGMIYLSTNNCLYQHKPGSDKIKEYEYPKVSCRPQSVSYLSSTKELLLTASLSEVFTFDGNEWSKVWEAFSSNAS